MFAQISSGEKASFSEVDLLGADKRERKRIERNEIHLHEQGVEQGDDHKERVKLELRIGMIYVDGL